MKLMFRLIVLLGLLPLAAMAEDRWQVFASGPFEVYTNGDERPARELLNHLEQFRHTFGTMLGKPEMETVFPIRLTIPKGSKKSAAPDRALMLEIGRILMDDNTTRMPAEYERGVLTLFSTLQVEGTRVTLGALPPESERTREWGRMHLLSADERFSGRLRVLLVNLQKGSELEPAFKNAFEKTPAEIEKEVDPYLAKTAFGTARLSGRPLDPQRQFHPKPADPEKVRLALEGIDAPSRAAEAELARAKTKAEIEKLALAYPRWADPHFRIAQIENDSTNKIAELKKAAALAPRNAGYWRALAETQLATKQFGDASKSWMAAERASVDDKERATIRAARKSIENERLDYEEAERKRIAGEKEREIQELKNQAVERIKLAEQRANKDATPLDPNQKIEQWWDGPNAPGKVRGSLEKMDCLGGPARLVIRADGGKLVQLLIRDPGKIEIRGGGEKTLGCGPQRPPRKIVVDYFPKPDPKTATAGEAALIELP